jgi:hypothetical protein
MEADSVKNTSTDDGSSQTRVVPGRKKKDGVSSSCPAHICHLEGKVTICIPVQTVLVLSG